MRINPRIKHVISTIAVLFFSGLPTTAETWEETIPKVEARAAFLLAEADRRGFAAIAQADGDDGWREYYRIHHECAILGRMLGVPELILEDEKIDVPEISDDMTPLEIIELYGAGRTYEAWVEQANFFLSIDLERKVTTWNESCVGYDRIRYAPLFIIGTGPDFSDFPAISTPSSNQAITMPDFDGRDNWARSFRTRIRNGLKEGPNFAGHYTVIMFGCGASCRYYFVADTETGKVFELPFGGDLTPEIQIEFEANSRLIQAFHFGSSSECVLSMWSFDEEEFTLENEDHFDRDGMGGCNHGAFNVITN